MIKKIKILILSILLITIFFPKNTLAVVEFNTSNLVTGKNDVSITITATDDQSLTIPTPFTVKIFDLLSNTQIKPQNCGEYNINDCIFYIQKKTTKTEASLEIKLGGLKEKTEYRLELFAGNVQKVDPVLFTTLLSETNPVIDIETGQEINLNVLVLEVSKNGVKFKIENIPSSMLNIKVGAREVASNTNEIKENFTVLPDHSVSGMIDGLASQYTTYILYAYNENEEQIGKSTEFTTLDLDVKEFETGSNLNTSSGYSKIYSLLVPLPVIGGSIDTSMGIGPFIAVVFRLLIILAGVLAVLMIVIGGIQYSLSDTPIATKAAAKNRIWMAIGGLILLLTSWLILNIINPELTKLRILFGDSAKIEAAENPDDPQKLTNGLYCGKYTPNSTWPPAGTTPSEKEVRDTLNCQGVGVSSSCKKIDVTSTMGIVCEKVGQQGCTSVAGLSNKAIEGLTKLRKNCKGNNGNECAITVTGGTECWLHGKGTNHQIGGEIVDLRRTDNLLQYITKEAGQKIYPKGSAEGVSYGTLYVVGTTRFVDEGDHLHVESW